MTAPRTPANAGIAGDGWQAGFLHALRVSGSSRGALTIIYDYEHAYRPNPADATPARGMTAHFTAEISVRPQIPKRAGFHGRSLWLKIWMTPRARGLRSSSVFSLLARNLEFTGSTLS